MFLNIFVDVFHFVGSSPLKQLTDGSISFTLFQFTIYNRFVGLRFMAHVEFPSTLSQNLGRQPSQGPFAVVKDSTDPATTNTLSWCRPKPSKSTYLCQTLPNENARI